MEELTKLLLSIGMGLIVLVIALALGSDITQDTKADMACASGFSFIENASFPNGRCCDSDFTDDCFSAHNGTHGAQAFTIAGNISSDGQQGLANLASKAPTIGTVAAIVVVLLLVVRVAVVTKEG